MVKVGPGKGLYFSRLVEKVEPGEGLWTSFSLLVMPCDGSLSRVESCKNHILRGNRGTPNLNFI